MINKLKTLKETRKCSPEIEELEGNRYSGYEAVMKYDTWGDWIEKEELQEVAKEWIKHLNPPVNGNHAAVISWIKHFFNLEDE